MIPRLHQTWTEAKEHNLSTLAAQQDHLRQRQQRLERKSQRLLDAYQAEIISLEELQRRRRTLGAELEQIEQERQQVARTQQQTIHWCQVIEIRRLAMEYGLVFPHSVTKFRHTFAATLEAEQDKLTPLSAELFQQLDDEFGTLEKRLAYYNEKIEAICAAHPVCQRLGTIPGIGPLTATALVAAVSDASHLKNGRQCAAWIGLVPRQHSTGGKARLLGVSKRGDVSLRTLLGHGARATLRWVGLKTARRSQWSRALIERRGKNKAAVAVAHKNARIVWALLTTDQVYTAETTAA
jgi:transposase